MFVSQKNTRAEIFIKLRGKTVVLRVFYVYTDLVTL